MTYCLDFRTRIFQLQEKKDWPLNQSVTTSTYSIRTFISLVKLSQVRHETNPRLELRWLYWPRRWNYTRMIINGSQLKALVWHNRPYIMLCSALLRFEVSYKKRCNIQRPTNKQVSLPITNKDLSTSRQAHGCSGWKRLGSGYAQEVRLLEKGTGYEGTQDWPAGGGRWMPWVPYEYGTVDRCPVWCPS